MGLKPWKLISKISLEILIVLLTLIFYILMPILIVFVVPIYIFRFIVFKTSWIFRPDLSKMLTVYSSSFVVKIPFVYDEPKNTVLVYALLDGHVEIGKFRESFLSLMQKKDEDTKGTYLYDELKMYITTYMGFFFWKCEKDFKIENHVKFYNFETNVPPVIELNSETVDQLCSNTLKKKFQKKQSPWDFHVLHSTSPNKVSSESDKNLDKKTLVIFRVHHSLADGYSLFKLVVKHAQMKVVQAKPNFKRSIPMSRQFLQFLHSVILFPFRAPYEAIGQLFRYDKNEWHLPESAMARESCGFTSDTLDIQTVKDIKNAHKASFAGVLLCAMAGGIRKSMLQAQNNQEFQLPTHLTCLTPLPLPGHPNKLRNYMTGCLIKLPIRISDSSQRLKLIEGNIRKIQYSTILQTNHVVHKIVGGLPRSIIEAVWKPTLSTAQLSSFPGPEEETTYLGHRMTDAGFMGCIDIGNLGVNITAFSYNGKIRMHLTVDKKILSTRKQVESLKDNIIQEFHTLYQEAIV